MRLSHKEIEILKEDIAKWKTILAKNTINVLISFKRPDQVVDVSRRDALLHFIAVIETILGEQEATDARTNSSTDSPSDEVKP
jgi:hypothetical protein